MYTQKDFDKYNLELIDVTSVNKVKDKVKCRNSEGYLVSTSLKMLRAGNTPVLFDRNPYVVYNFKKYMKSVGCEFLDDYYIVGKKSHFITKCGHEVYELINEFKSGGRQQCEKCKLEKGNAFAQRMDKKTKDIIESLGCEFIEKKRYGSYSEVTYIGECGHTIVRNCGNLTKTKYPKLCSACARKKCEGNKRAYLSKEKAELNKEEWLTIPCTVYIVNLYNDNESLYKIGLTKNKPYIRLAHIPYKKIRKIEYILKLIFIMLYILKNICMN